MTAGLSGPLLIAVLALAACRPDLAAPESPTTDRTGAALPHSRATAPVSGAAAEPTASPFAPQPTIAAAVQDPAAILQDWAGAIERRDWTVVRALWGNGGADSGLSPRAFARRWDQLRRPRVTIGTGEQEGAAGSLYYTAPVALRDGARRLSGTVTLRRVNDVAGATSEQLRWHIDPGSAERWAAPR